MSKNKTSGSYHREESRKFLYKTIGFCFALGCMTTIILFGDNYARGILKAIAAAFVVVGPVYFMRMG